MRIFLVGFMGAGKSLIGHSLAQELNIPFFDLDKQIEIRQGCSVSDFFRIHGEPEFRKEENLVLKEIVHQHNSFVIATGGGTPCFFGNMEWMNENGITVYLNVLLITLIKRLIKDKKNRPLIASLSDSELQQLVKNLLKDREQFYRIAKIEILPELYSPHELIDHLISQLRIL